MLHQLYYHNGSLVGNNPGQVLRSCTVCVISLCECRLIRTLIIEILGGSLCVQDIRWPTHTHTHTLTFTFLIMDDFDFEYRLHYFLLLWLNHSTCQDLFANHICLNLCEWVHEWVTEWMSEWVSDWVGGWWLCMCSGCVVAAHFIPFFNDRNGDDASADGTTSPHLWLDPQLVRSGR